MSEANSNKIDCPGDGAQKEIIGKMATFANGDINAWATWCYFLAHGSTGFPTWEECHGDTRRGGAIVADPPILSNKDLELLKQTNTIQMCDESSKIYDGTPRKYEPSAKRVTIDTRVLDSIVKVEMALRSMRAPIYFRCYLLFLYPQWGKYVPVRPDYWREDPVKAFLDTEAAIRRLIGNCRGKYLDRAARALVANMVNQLEKELKSKKVA